LAPLFLLVHGGHQGESTDTGVSTVPTLETGQRPPLDLPRQRVGSGESSAGDDESNSRLVSRAIKRAQLGDREALGFLYARYADNIYGYALSIVRNHHQAEDITQHVFAKLVRVIGKYEERDVPFFAWIIRVARNVAVDYIRSERLVPVEEVRQADHGGAWERLLDGRTQDLREAFAALPQSQREVVILRHYGGFSPGEIAKLTGRSEGSIHGLHHRGRRTLATELANRGIGPSTARALVAGGRASA
jgi:RNA polymerase sigma-70 factor (ECF subfamily)